MAIDLTDRFNTAEFMNGGPAQWAINRNQVPFKQIIIHHTTEVDGRAYGVPIRSDVTQAQEENAILALARDHRQRLGIGPGYNYVVFQSGRMYAVGKAGTQRRHTSNTDGRTDGRTWNYDSIAICAFGGFNVREPSDAMLQAIEGEIDAIRLWSITAPNPRIMSHRDANPRTECPGDKLQVYVDRWARGESVTVPPTPSPVPVDTRIERAIMQVTDARAKLDEALSILQEP